MSWSHTKDITTKIIFLLCLSFTGEAKTINDVEGIINAPEQVVTDDEISLDNSEIVLEKNKKGNIEVPWEVLQEYDLDKKKLTENLKKIINKKVSIKGFMIPLDYSAKSIKEFLLVPYIPSCAHVPPPPANMIISVDLKAKGIKPSYYPIEVIGTINIAKNVKIKDEYMPEGSYSLVAKSVSEITE